MIRKFLFIFLFALVVRAGLLDISFAQGDVLNGRPLDIIEHIVDEAQGPFEIQNTKLNNINAKSSMISHAGKYKIAGTLDRIRVNIQPYLQWLVFLGLTIAVILLIWNGFLLVTNSAIGRGDPKTAKENIKNIVLGVIIMSSFVALIKITVAVLNIFFER